MGKDDVTKFSEFCQKELDLVNAKDNYHYKSLAICLIDCVYSLRAQYFSTTVPVVERYAEAFTNGDKYAEEENLKDLMRHIDDAGGYQVFAEEILKNRQQLSGRLKSEVCYEIANKLVNHLHINTLDDFRNYEDEDLIKIVLESVRGFKDAGINYLFMLAGDPNKCKPDIHILNCIEEVLHKKVTNDECQELFTKTVLKLKENGINITVRDLDSLIWEKYQIGNKRG